MGVVKKLGQFGLVPVVVIDNADDALSTADALTAGGLPVMEITLRTAVAIDAIRIIAQKCPNVLLGAGTVFTLEQCKASVEAGAKFIVSPGFDLELVEWCLKNGVAVIPGCVTPTEITRAVATGLNVLKFFPANVYGGVSAMKALSAPFGMVKFIPTGGINLQNLSEFADAPYVHAVGGSFMCTKADITAGNFDRITQLTKEAIKKMLGFEMKHIGINTVDDTDSEKVAKALCLAFGFDYIPGNSSNFAGRGIEVVKGKGTGGMGHIAIACNNLTRAAQYLDNMGVAIDWSNGKDKNGRLMSVYLRDEYAGFAIHLLQK